MNDKNMEDLGIIRSNLINGNLTDSRKLIKEYGRKLFPLNYLDYLYFIHATDDELIADFRKALVQFSLA